MLIDGIEDFLRQNGISGSRVEAAGETFLRIEYISAGRMERFFILPAEIFASSPEEAEAEYRKRMTAKEALQRMYGTGAVPARAVTVPRDRWESRRTLYEARLLAHCGKFRAVFARNCIIRKIDRVTANAFLSGNHSYGTANCRYCYGLYEKTAESRISGDSQVLSGVAAFSNARKWIKDGREIRSYEWVRYASAGGVRIAGGMGKVLAGFIRDVKPDDIMSYADSEWSDGEVYAKLGFVREGTREPVLFEIDTTDWSRRKLPSGTGSSTTLKDSGCRTEPIDKTLPAARFFMNEGSIKYRLRLSGCKG